MVPHWSVEFLEAFEGFEVNLGLHLMCRGTDRIAQQLGPLSSFWITSWQEWLGPNSLPCSPDLASHKVTDAGSLFPDSSPYRWYFKSWFDMGFRLLSGLLWKGRFRFFSLAPRCSQECPGLCMSLREWMSLFFLIHLACLFPSLKPFPFTWRLPSPTASQTVPNRPTPLIPAPAFWKLQKGSTKP